LPQEAAFVRLREREREQEKKKIEEREREREEGGGERESTNCSMDRVKDPKIDFNKRSNSDV
jgi:hypothetical protein